jgi:HlyD family secretion protein
MTAKAARFALLAVPLLLAACEAENTNVMVGTLERDRIELKVESTEPIHELLVTDGAIVAPGDAILQQDTARLDRRLAQVEAQRDQSAARLAELVRGPREESIREARARLEASAVVTGNALSDYERAREIFQRNLSDESTRDRARAAWESAQAREQADREALGALLSGTTVEELQQAQAQVAQAEAVVQQVQLDRERLRIKAPVAGRIDKVLYQLGERPNVGQTVAVLLDSTRTFARIYVPSEWRAIMTPGTAVEMRADGVDRVLQGSVRWVSSDASFTPYFALTEYDRSRLSYLAEVDLEDAGKLPVGLPVEAVPAGMAGD